MDLFIETPNQVAQRQIREQQQQIEALNKATSAFNASQEAYLSAVKNASNQGAICSVDSTCSNTVYAGDTNTLLAGLSQEDIDVIARATRIAQDHARDTLQDHNAPSMKCDVSGSVPQKKTKVRFRERFVHMRRKKQNRLHETEYQREIAFDKHREKLRVLGMMLRMLGIVVLTPLMVVVIFTAAYLMTCILNGATPAELPGLLNVMWDSGITFVMELTSLI